MDISYIATLLLTIFRIVSSVRHTVYWDRELIPELGDGGLLVTLEVDDWMDVLCPYVPQNDDMRRHKDNEVYLHIFNVTEDEYANCDTTHGIRLQSCDDPMREKKLTTKFQERSPYPFGFTFRPGATYYYLSKPPHDLSRGCTRNTMKMAINVNKKGSVFPPDERRNTKTYHRSQTGSDGGSRNSGLMPKPKTARPGKPNRHNHHDRITPTSSSTRPTNLRVATAKNEPVRASPVQHDGPGNGASRTFSILFAIISSATTIFACILLTDFGLIAKAK